MFHQAYDQASMEQVQSDFLQTDKYRRSPLVYYVYEDLYAPKNVII